MDCEIDGLAVEIDPAELSIAGLFIESPSPPPLDAEVRVFLSIGALQVETTGHVVKSVSLDAAKRERRRPGYGILFSRLPERTRAALREALEGKPPAAAEAAPRESIRPPESIKPRESIRPRMSFAPQAKQPDPKELEVLARLSAELANLEQQPAWTVLGISQSADAEAARQAFFAASKRYHPHIYARYSHPEIKAVVTQLFIAYKRAFTTMTKTGRGTRGVTAARAARSGNPPGRSSDPGNR